MATGPGERWQASIVDPAALSSAGALLPCAAGPSPGFSTLCSWLSMLTERWSSGGGACRRLRGRVPLVRDLAAPTHTGSRVAAPPWQGGVANGLPRCEARCDLEVDP